MLQSLRIRNLALLDEVALEFEPGFTAVTGETGAGKSILLGALSLLAGERAEKTIIRQGAETCEIEASLFFAEPAAIDEVLARLELPKCEEGVLLLRRSLSQTKPPRITVNGRLATLAALHELGGHWIDFHGPSEPRRLLNENTQLELLDLYARDAAVLGKYQEAYSAWRQLHDEREQLARETQLSPAQLEFLTNQLTELDALELTSEAIEQLERDFQRMSGGQELAELAATLATGISGEDGVEARLAGLVREARHLADIDAASRPLADRLSQAAVELADLGTEFSALGQQVQFEPEQAEALTARINTWLDAKRKHGGDVATVAAAREALRQRLDAQGDLEGAMLKIEHRIGDALKAVRVAGRTLYTEREKAAKALSKIAARSIGELGFKKSEFVVRVIQLNEPGPRGDSHCEFLFSPNVGEEPMKLSRIASSGELARVMLALKAVLADLDGVPLLVFDEVDANVGGEIGQVVGEKMAAIAKKHQVLCVTHLPQVAAQATAHVVVTKDQSSARATVRISPIHESRKTRVTELARMLGDRNAKSALAHAEELLGTR